MNNHSASEHALMSVSDQIDSLFEQYINDNNHEPKYAHCLIAFIDEIDSKEVTIKLSLDIDETEDDYIFYYCNSTNDLKSLSIPGSEDFILKECLALSCSVWR